jgi:FdhD protein
MDDSNRETSSVNYVHAERFSTSDAKKASRTEEVCVIRETPLAIDVEGLETYTLLCTPMDELALAAGFLFGEGVVGTLDDFKVLKMCDDDPGMVRVRLAGKIPRIGDSGRNLMITSSCGACGSEDLQKRIDSLPAVGRSMTIEARLLRAVFKELRDGQNLFQISGGTHGAALFDKKGRILSLAEDTGRHNALDKAIGKCLLSKTACAGRGVVLTSRLSFEMIGRCARAGIEIVAAVSAPTSLALEVAEKCGITLCAFVRESRATVFTHPGRIINVSE